MPRRISPRVQRPRHKHEWKAATKKVLVTHGQKQAYDILKMRVCVGKLPSGEVCGHRETYDIKERVIM